MNKNKLKILFLSAEVAPFAKVGGLSDVAGSLPPALNKLGADIRICMPLYGLINRKKFNIKKMAARRSESGQYQIWKTKLPNTSVPVYLIGHKYFKKKEVYWGKGQLTNEIGDIARFALFTELAFETVQATGFKPDIIHANDWHASLAPYFLSLRNKQDNYFKSTRTVLTIHNLAHQGKVKSATAEAREFYKSYPALKPGSRDEILNFMAEGILSFDAVTTVSPSYALEVLTAEYGEGLEKILRKRRHNFYGIINGIDTDFFNSEHDKLISYNYNSAECRVKRNNKIALQQKLGLPSNGGIALIGIVSRLVRQKGFDLIDEKMIKSLPCQIVVLGSGENKIQKRFISLAKKYPDKIKAVFEFDEKLAHQIYAGADIFLMPSRFEPCGLGQMIAMRYGTVPVVHDTGGLHDTVIGYKTQIADTRSSKNRIVANGFVFKKLDEVNLLKTINKALKIYYGHPEVWRKLQENGMKADFSWRKPAKEYVKLYKQLLKSK